MYDVSWLERNGVWRGNVIPIEMIAWFIQLVPKFGSCCTPELTAYNSMDICHHYYISSFTDKEIYQSVWYIGQIVLMSLTVYRDTCRWLLKPWCDGQAPKSCWFHTCPHISHSLYKSCHTILIKSHSIVQSHPYYQSAVHFSSNPPWRSYIQLSAWPRSV